MTFVLSIASLQVSLIILFFFSLRIANIYLTIIFFQNTIRTKTSSDLTILRWKVIIVSNKLEIEEKKSQI